MESSAALPHAARELLLKGGGCAVNFECTPELCAPLRAELARSGRSVGFVRADEGFYDRMDTAAYLRLFERMAGTRGMADAALACALPGFVDSKNEEKTERNAGYLVVSQSGGGMLRQGTRKGIRRTPANRGMRAHRIVKGLDISEDVCHGMCP